MDVLKSLAAAGAVLSASAAQAHVSVQPTTATAGAYQVLRFGVGHGCDGKPTTALRIEIPPGVDVARPQPKPGWTLGVESDGDRVAAIVWRGGLPPDQFDEFLILAKLPPAGERLTFPAIQSCPGAENRWVERRDPDGPRPTHPAPVVTIAAPASPESGHDHHP